MNIAQREQQIIRIQSQSPYPTINKALEATLSLEAIEDVASDPNSNWTQITGKSGQTHTKKGKPVRWSAEGTRNGVDIRAIVETAGDGVITGYPTNLPPNP